jgi:hypothetical protein
MASANLAAKVRRALVSTPSPANLLTITVKSIQTITARNTVKDGACLLRMS